MSDRYKETRKKLAAVRVKLFFIRLLRAFRFYATKCGCRDGHDEWPLKFRLCRCGDCRRKGDE
jgi:hypothetical protein